MFSVFKIATTKAPASRFGASQPDRRRRSRVARRPRVEGLENRDLMAALGMDPTFGLGGVALANNPASAGSTSYNSFLSNVAVQSDGKIVAVGTRTTGISSETDFTSTNDVLVERLNPDSSLDTTFGAGGVATIPLMSGTTALDGSGVDLAVQSDGKILVLGSTSTRDTTGGSTSDISDFAVARLNANGTLDTTFNGTGYRLVDFTPTGTTDNVNDTPVSLALAPDGKVVVAGNTQTPGTVVADVLTGGNEDMAVARLNADGTLDTTFNGTGEKVVAFDLGGAKDDTVAAVAVGSDGRVVLAGSASQADITSGTLTSSTTDIAVARLNADGSFDGTFGTGGKTTIAYNLGGDNRDSASAAALVGDKIVIVGTSTVSSSTTTSGSSSSPTVTDLTITRLTSAGVLDSTFNNGGKFLLPVTQAGTTYSTSGSALAVLPDSSLIVGGSASRPAQFDSIALFAKIGTTGALDPAFGTGGVALLAQSSLNGNIAALSDGKIVFATGGGIGRTSAPAPVVVSAQTVLTGTGRRVKGSKSLTIQFNTALNPSLAGSKTTYQVRLGTKGKRFLTIKNVSYDPTKFQVTINLKQAAPTKGTLQVLISASGIAGLDSALLNNGQGMAITVVRGVAATRA